MTSSVLRSSLKIVWTRARLADEPLLPERSDDAEGEVGRSDGGVAGARRLSICGVAMLNGLVWECECVYRKRGLGGL